MNANGGAKPGAVRTNGAVRPAFHGVPTKKAPLRACDACFVSKEKCIRSEPNKDCRRCERLAKACLSDRPVKPAGRRKLCSRIPGLPTSRDTTAPAPKLPYSLHPFGVLFRHLGPTDELILRELINPSNFTRLMVMPRLGPAMHRDAVQVFLQNYDDLADGLFSMFGAFACALERPFTGYDAETNLQRATRALRKWCAMPLPHGGEEETAVWMWLGTGVMIFAHCGLGCSAAPVRRAILAHVATRGVSGWDAMRNRALEMSFVALDVLECLFYRERPVMDWDEASVVEPGSFPGLVSGLLRLMYRLCLINCADDEGEQGPYDWDALATLEREVQDWQPELDPNELEALDATQISHLLTRARVHKTAMLLFIHRLHHLFGEEDSAANTLSVSIVSDLDLATATTKRPPDWVGMPVILAAIEAQGARKRQRVQRDIIRLYFDCISPKARSMALEWLRAVWALRDGYGGGFRWIDMMGVLPPLCVYI